MQTAGLNANLVLEEVEEQVRELSSIVWRLNLSKNQKGIDRRRLRGSNGEWESEESFSGRVQMQMVVGNRWGRREVKEIPPSPTVRF